MLNYCNVFQCYTGENLYNRKVIRSARAQTVIRIAALLIKDLLFKDTDSNVCDLDGFMAQDYLLMPKELGYNCTVVADTPGELGDSDSYTGCIGRLQQGSADFGQIFTAFPLIGDPIDYSVVIMHDHLSFMTAYERPQRRPTNSDLITSFMQFDLLSASGFMAVLALLISVLKLQQQGSAAFKVAQYLFQYTGPETRTVSSKVLGLTMLAGFFIVNNFYINFILSDILREIHPAVLRRFSDILSPDTDIRMTSDIPIFDVFRNTKNAQLRQMSEKLEIQTAKNTIAEGGLVSYNIFAGPPKDRLFGYLGSDRYLECSKKVACLIMKRNDVAANRSLWVPKDSPFLFMKAAAYSRSLDANVKAVFDLALLHAFEHDLYGDVFYDRIMNTLQMQIFGQDEHPDVSCYSKVILSKEPENSDGIGLQNMYWILIAMELMHFIALTALLRERTTR